MSKGDEVTAVTTITHPVGLHARPAIAFTKLAKTFAKAEIGIRGADDHPWIDAKSIVRVMALKLRTGAALQIRAMGADADAAVQALTGLIERDFDEAEHT